MAALGLGRCFIARRSSGSWLYAATHCRASNAAWPFSSGSWSMPGSTLAILFASSRTYFWALSIHLGASSMPGGGVGAVLLSLAVSTLACGLITMLPRSSVIACHHLRVALPPAAFRGGLFTRMRQRPGAADRVISQDPGRQVFRFARAVFRVCCSTTDRAAC